MAHTGKLTEKQRAVFTRVIKARYAALLSSLQAAEQACIGAGNVMNPARPFYSLPDLQHPESVQQWVAEFPPEIQPAVSAYLAAYLKLDALVDAENDRRNAARVASHKKIEALRLRLMAERDEKLVNVAFDAVDGDAVGQLAKYLPTMDDLRRMVQEAGLPLQIAAPATLPLLGE